MKVIVTSDLHGHLPTIKEKAELLLICGDILPLNIQRDCKESRIWLINDFTDWCNSLNVEKIIFIAGNHDFIFERNSTDMFGIFNNKIKYLQNNSYDYLSDEGIIYKIYGTPLCKKFGNWAFMDYDLTKAYKAIPNDCDILISHDAPDLCNLGVINEGWNKGVNAGNKILAEAIIEKHPKYVFCGHIHSGNHIVSDYNGIKLCNVSLLNESYHPTNYPVTIEIV